MTSTVTSGEGAESDDDSGHTPSFMKNTMVTNTMVTSTMVSGEASETDDEDDDIDKGDPYSSPMEAEQPLLDDDDETVTLTTTFDDTFDMETLENKKAEKAKRQKIVYKYDTPLHRKLREKNLELRSNLVEGVTQLYKAAALKLDTSYYHITKSQTSVQDIAYNTKIILEDLHIIGHTLKQTEELNYLSTLKTAH